VADLGEIGLTVRALQSHPQAMCNTEQCSWGPQTHKPSRAGRQTPKAFVGVCPTDGSWDGIYWTLL